MNFHDFQRDVERAGLKARKCSPIHWQIIGGRRLVNVWPNTKRGFRFQPAGQAVRTGRVEQAIAFADPPSWPSSSQTAEKLSPLETTIAGIHADLASSKSRMAPWEGAPSTPHLGIIRRFIRWLW